MEASAVARDRFSMPHQRPTGRRPLHSAQLEVPRIRQDRDLHARFPLTLSSFLAGGKLFRASIFVSAGGARLDLDIPFASNGSLASLRTVVLGAVKLSCSRRIHVARMPSPTGQASASVCE